MAPWHRVAWGVGLSMTLLACARAAEAPAPDPAPLAFDDVVYKGIVGKALDAVRMDPEHRLALQRTHAVVSGTFTGRSLSVWAGVTHPILLIGGFAWGLFAAMNIKPETTPTARAAALSAREALALPPEMPQEAHLSEAPAPAISSR